MMLDWYISEHMVPINNQYQYTESKNLHVGITIVTSSQLWIFGGYLELHCFVYLV